MNTFTNEITKEEAEQMELRKVICTYCGESARDDLDVGFIQEYGMCTVCDKISADCCATDYEAFA